MNTFSIPATTLLAMMKQVKRVVPKTGNMPVLRNMKFSFEDGVLSVSAQGNEQAITCRKAVAAIGKGAFLFETQKMEKALAARKKIDVIVEMLPGGNQHGMARVSFGSTSVTVGSIEAAEHYPAEFMLDDAGQTFSIDKGEMRKTMDYLMPAISKDCLRYAMTGIYMEAKDNALTMAATNGFVLVERQVPAEASESVTTVVPDAAWKLLKGCTGTHKTGRVEVDVVDRFTRFRFDNGDIETHVETVNIPEKYPDYRQVIPSFSEHAMRTEAEATRLATELKTVIPFAKNRCCASFDDEHAVKFEVLPPEYVVDGNHGASVIVNSGHALVRLPGPAVEYRMSYDVNLLDYVLSLFDGDIVSIEADEVKRGTLIQQLDYAERDVRMRALLMPSVDQGREAYGYALPTPDGERIWTPAGFPKGFADAYREAGEPLMADAVLAEAIAHEITPVI